MAITLVKKNPISLVKEKPGLIQNIVAGLGWDEAIIKWVNQLIVMSVSFYLALMGN
jgi:stress response protein SCP2